MRQVMRRHGIGEEGTDSEFGTGDMHTEGGALSARSSTVDGSCADVGEVEEEELPPELPPLPTVVEETREEKAAASQSPLSIAGLSILA